MHYKCLTSPQCQILFCVRVLKCQNCHRNKCQYSSEIPSHTAMEYFRSGLKSVLGGPQPENQPTGAETVGPINFMPRNMVASKTNLKVEKYVWALFA